MAKHTAHKNCSFAVRQKWPTRLVTIGNGQQSANNLGKASLRSTLPIVHQVFWQLQPLGVEWYRKKNLSKPTTDLSVSWKRQRATYDKNWSKGPQQRICRNRNPRGDCTTKTAMVSARTKAMRAHEDRPHYTKKYCPAIRDNKSDSKEDKELAHCQRLNISLIRLQEPKTRWK